MKLNQSMKALLEKYSIRLTDITPHNCKYTVWRKTDAAGRAYWGVLSFWGLDKRPISADADLSELEWDGNEVYLDAKTDEEVADMLTEAIGVIRFWKSELETKYPETPFYIFASYDNGDMLILDEGELPTKSVTLRFWADRGNDAVIDFERWEQPVIMECCNGVL